LPKHLDFGVREHPVFPDAATIQRAQGLLFVLRNLDIEVGVYLDAKLEYQTLRSNIFSSAVVEIIFK
jgi:hypothetical protein